MSTTETARPAMVVAVSVREWFDKTWGNTYMSVRVDVDGQQVGVAPFRYGHGDLMALDVARELMDLAGYPVPPEGGSYKWRQAGFAVSVDVCEVQRRRDMHAGWKADFAAASGGRGSERIYPHGALQLTAAAALFATGWPLADALATAEAVVAEPAEVAA